MSLNLKRNYPVLIAFVLVIGFFLLVLGGQRVIAYTTDKDIKSSEEQSGTDYTGETALFDDTVVHSIQVIMTDEDYDTMIATYQQTGEKDYFRADIIIDGIRINDVGIRLKGNSSLMTALGGSGNMAGGMGGIPAGIDPDNLPEGFDPQNVPDPGNIPQRPGGGQAPAGNGAQPGAGNPQDMGQAPAAGQMPDGFGMGGMSSTGQTGETKIPFLVKFDEFVSGQTYQGHTKLALRTYGASYDEAMLEEPLTNYVYTLMDLPATSTAYTGLQINNEAETFYVISEVVDDTAYLEKNLTNTNGVLYKAELGSSLTYVDDNPSSYSEMFTQQTRVHDADMAPLIEFMKFLSESDDAAFAAELPERLDVDAFATYLAINTLLVNNDSIAGMNNNYYLYYDDDADCFTLLYWDGNESLGGLGMGTSADSDLYFQNLQTVGGRGGIGGGQNILLERFIANPDFLNLYEEKLVEVYETAFVSGALAEKTEELSALVRQADADRSLVNLENYEQSVSKIQTFITERMNYLDTTELLGK